MSEISAAARQELVQAVGERYRGGTPEAKHRILGEFVVLTGYHRKHALRLLNGGTGTPAPPKRGRLRLYDEAVRQALIVFWEASDRICGKRLKPLLPVLLPALEGHGHVTLDPTVRRQLLAVSASTIDRMLWGARAAAGGRRSRAKTTPAVRRRVPVRTFADWHEPAPGFVEADLVIHCGESMAGSFASTLVLTDIASGWTECIALLVREGSLIVEALDRLRETLPFPLRGIDTDNGSEFINEPLITFCRDHGIEFTRSRPYRKNDQAWVEQKNGSVVRRLVGYGRLEGVAAGDALARLYSASRLFVNFFQPSFKLAEKERVGAHVRKRYHAPETPCARLLASTAIAESMKDRLRAVLGTLDPLRLLDEIRTVQHYLAGLAAGEHIHVLPHRHADLDTFLKSLAHAWRDGEVRPTHRAGPKPPRHWRTRKDPFEAAWPRVVTWLESEPDRTAKELFARLREERPGAFTAGQVRTLQRRVKEWRTLAARRLVFAEPFADLGHHVAPSAALS
jgi:Integrase core domain